MGALVHGGLGNALTNLDIKFKNVCYTGLLDAD